MQTDLIVRLKTSIDYLEESIKDALRAFKSRGASSDKLNRLNEYFKLVEAQRGYIAELEAKISNHELDDLSRLVSLINGVSTMIKEDARSLLDEMTEVNKPGDEYDC